MVTELSVAELLKIANRAGAAFRLQGGQLRVTAPADATLRPVLAALKAQRDAVWEILGGSELDAPSLELIARLGVEAVVPRTTEEALALIAEMEADSDANTPEAVKRSRGGLLGLDIETAAIAGEEDRPVAQLRLRDGLLAKHQPTLKSGAALDPHRSSIRLVQLYGGGKRCLVLDTKLVPIAILGGSTNPPAITNGHSKGAVAKAHLYDCNTKREEPLGTLIVAHDVHFTNVLGRRAMVVHNAGFELRFLAEAGLAMPHFEDTMQAVGLLLGAHRRSLEEAVDAYLGLTLPKGLQRSDWSAPCLSPGQIAYAALDAIVAFRLWLRLRLELREKQRGPAYVLQRDVTPATVRMTARGITLDRKTHREQVIEWQTALAHARKRFSEASSQAPPVTPAQTRALLAQLLPPEVIEAWPRTGKQQELSTKTADLKRHLDTPAIGELLAINAMTKLSSSFGEELAAKVSAKSGRLHPTYNIASTKAGRFSATTPNIQQIPKHKAKGLRACFVAAIGMKFVIADYSAMELRAAAAIANDAVMNVDFAAGVDLHRRQAAEMLGIPQGEVTTQQRDAAKPICFGTIYGAGGRGLAASAWNNYNLVLPVHEAEVARQAFLARYPALAAWMDRNFVQSNRRGFIAVGRLGRVIEASWEHQQRVDRRYNWRFPDEEEDDFEEEGTSRQPPQWRTMLKRTLCCNAPIQGACADAAMRVLILVDAALSAAGIDGGLVLFVHDEFVIEVPESDAERARTLLVEAMTQAFAEAFPDAPLNGLVLTRIATAWGPREEHDDAAEPVDADASSPDLPARRVPCPVDGGDTAPSTDQRARATGRGLSPRERMDVPADDAGLSDQDGDEEVQRKPEPSAAFLARTCDRCGASPCTVFGATTTFCTLRCWQASYAAS